ncbi:transcription factor [Ganoderma sinense ZZ0214-1]|uniref:Transcription factor n=1 Tax=Ganoderma sinense ZZ0214-1 TaxID=1077348 RepID=A0A2G8S6G1_9APHY|nr:transcription factor [Ganoderma sinense ZZ0214-1]
MVFVGDKKYACETCIKGHRSSSCKHTDRPLFEIKKKGRPVTQCEHCRELRKTRQIHVKCVCESKELALAEEGPVVVAGAPGSKGAKLPARAAFPSGLPEELLEASVASQPFSEGSDSEQSSRGCCCKDTAICTCWTPRTRAKRPAKAGERRGSEARPIAPSPNEALSEPAALVAQAHAAGNRPVLPKPPTERPDSPSRTSHNPSLTQTGRLPSHGQSFFSPYGRAYDYSHGPGPNYTSFGDGSASSLQHLLNAAPSPSAAAPFDAWPLGADNAVAGFPISPASASPPVCGCGTACACPGCMEHNGPSADPNAPCADPNTCVACLECNINTLAALATGNPRAMFDTTGLQNVDDWLSSVPEPISGALQPPPIFSQSQSQSQSQYDSAMMQQSYGLWNAASAPMQQAEDCCGGQCRCPPGMCRCSADRYDSASGRTLTFAVSGERAPCRDGGVSQTSAHNAVGGPSGSRSAQGSGSSRIPFPEGQVPWFPPTLAVPRTSLSRASSSSSKSSGPLSASSSSPAPFGDLSRDSQRSGVAAEVGSSMGNLNMKAGMPPMQSSGSPARRRGSLDHNEYRTQTQARRY